MPQAVVLAALPAVVGAGAAIYGAKKQADASKEAVKAQTASSDEALRYAKEQEALRRADYERAYAEWQAGRNALLNRYGVSVPSVPRAAPPSSAPGAVPRTGEAPAAGGPFNLRANPNLAAVMAARNATNPTADSPRLMEPTEWNDWNRYGLRSA